MQRPIYFILFSTLSLIMVAQSALAQKAKYSIYATKVWVNPEISDLDPVYLYQLRDTSIVFSQSPIVYASELTTYPVSDVYSLELRRKGSIGTGILLGAAAGFIANGVIDLFRKRPTQSACGVCQLLTELRSRRGPNRQRYIGSVIAGGVVGGLIGAFKVRVPIGRSQNRYNFHQKQLEKHLIYR